MNGYLLLAIELAAILVVCVGLALFLGWVLGKRSARAKLAAEQDSSQTPATDALKTSRGEEKKEPAPLTSRAVPVTAQTSPVTTQPPSPIVASASDPQQPVSSPSPFAPSPSPTGNAAPAETGTARPDPLNDRTISDDSAVDTHLIPRIADQTTSPAPEPKASDPRLLDAEARANEAESKARDAETKAREAEDRIEEANQRAREAEAKAQEAEAKVEAAEAKVEEAGQQITQADQRVSEAEAKAQEANQMARAAETRAAEAETRVQEANQHINDAEQARRQVVELEERINKQEIDMARLENRATTAWDKTMPTLIERIESLEDDLSHARREAAELQAMLASERDQATPTPAPEADTEEEASEGEPVHEDTGQTEVIKEDSWQTIGPGTGAAQETPIAFASSTLPSMQPAKEDEGENEEPEDLEPAEEAADVKAAATEKPEPANVTAEDAPAEDTPEEDAPAEAMDTDPVDEKTDETEENADEAADTKVAATEEPEPTNVTAEDAPAEDAPAEAVDTDPVDEKTEENEEQQPTAEESITEDSTESEEPDVHSHEQLAPTAVVEHEVEIPDHDTHDEEPADLEPAEETPDTNETADTKVAATEEPEPDEEATKTRLMPLIPEPTFTNFDELTAAWKARETVRSEEKPQSTSHTTAWPEPEDVEAVTATRLIPVIKEEEPAPRPNGKDDLEALTDTGSFARLIATGPAPEAPSFTAPLDIPGTEYLTPSTPAYPVTTHHDDATIPDIPRITAPIAQPFEAKQDDATPDSRHDATPSKSDLLIDETEVDEVPVTAGLAEPEPAADPRVNAGHIIAPQFSMTKEHDGILRSPLERKGQQISISLEEDYTLADPIDEEIEVMDAPEEEFPVGVGIPPEDYPRAR